MCGSREDGTAPKNHKPIRFFSNTGPDTLKNYKATKPAFNVWPSSARKRWSAFSVTWIVSPLFNKEKNVRVGPPLINNSKSAINHDQANFNFELVYGYELKSQLWQELRSAV